jgi:hypothetical protein
MSTDASPREPALAPDQLSALIVAGIAILALLLGWALKTGVEYQTRPIQEAGITARIPDDWLVQYGAGDLVFLTRNPRSLNQQYRVTLLAAAVDLAATAQQRSNQRAQLVPSFRVLTETPIVINGRDGYKVSYALVDAEGSEMPVVIEGADYYFMAGDRVLVVSLESDADNFADSLPRFFRFMESVTYQGGE